MLFQVPRVREPTLPPARLVVGGLTVAVACYLGSVIGGRLRFDDASPAILFPPYALLTAALFFAPVRFWPVYLLAATAGCLSAHRMGALAGHAPLAELANYAKAVTAAVGLRWACGPDRRLDSLRAMCGLLWFGAALGPALGAFIGAPSVGAVGGRPDYWLAWRGWFLSNALTALTLLPVVLTAGAALVAGERMRRPTVPRAAEGAALAASLLAAGVVAVSTDHGRIPAGPTARLYWPVPFLLWAAARFGVGGTGAALLAIAVLSIVGANRGLGPFLGSSVRENVLDVQLFLLIVATPFLLLAALLSDQRRSAAARRDGEREARRRFAELAAVYRTAPAGLAFLDADLRYVRVNDRLAEMHSLPAASHVGRSVRDVLPPAVAEQVEQACRRALSTGEPVSNVDVTGQAPAGAAADRDRHWLASYERVCDEGGEVLGLNVVVLEITARKRAQDRLRESEARFRSAANAVPALLSLLGPDGQPQFANQALLDFYGVTESEFGLALLSASVHPEDRAAHLAALDEAVRGHKAFEAEARLRRADGQYRWLSTRAVPRFAADGRFLGHATACLDVTDRVTAERARRAAEAALARSYAQVRDLAHRLIAAQEAERARIARELHDDVNQQLAAMSIALSALTRRAPDGSDFARSLADLQGRAMQMAETLRGLSHDLHPGVLRHAGITAALQAYCGEFRARHRIDVAFSPAPTGLEAVPHDAALCFYRVVQEALGNIAKHAGATRVDVTLGRGGGGALELGIADNGRGFDLAEARHGTGLGLVSLDERVRLAGGSIKIRTEVGKGTQLRVVIPTEPPASASVAVAATGTTGGPGHGTRDRLVGG